jgi:hypothetical protein
VQRAIALVEDPLIRKLLKDILVRHGFGVFDYNQKGAIDILAASGCANHVLVTNMPAPFLQFAERLPLVYLSSSPDPDLAARFHSCRCVKKPFQPEELVDAVRLLADGA